jgi:predicted transcriptional regulator
MMAEGVFTVRIALEKQQQLDALAQALDRSRNWLVGEAIDQYLAVQAWQLAQIQAGLAEAEAGQLVPHEQVLADAQAKIAQARRARS